MPLSYIQEVAVTLSKVDYCAMDVNCELCGADCRLPLHSVG